MLAYSASLESVSCGLFSCTFLDATLHSDCQVGRLGRLWTPDERLERSGRLLTPGSGDLPWIFKVGRLLSEAILCAVVRTFSPRVRGLHVTPVILCGKFCQSPYNADLLISVDTGRETLVFQRHSYNADPWLSLLYESLDTTREPSIHLETSRVRTGNTFSRSDRRLSIFAFVP